MEAVAALLAGLPLQPEESDRGDLMEAKSQPYILIRLLNTCATVNLFSLYKFKNLKT
jgi:neurofibromin 1